MKKLKFIDLFAGIGGFHLALKSHGMECVFTSEIDIHSRKTYEANFKEMVLSIQDDLKAVLHVKEIAFEGETSLNSERFGINIGVVN